MRSRGSQFRRRCGIGSRRSWRAMLLSVDIGGHHDRFSLPGRQYRASLASSPPPASSAVPTAPLHHLLLPDQIHGRGGVLTTQLQPQRLAVRPSWINEQRVHSRDQLEGIVTVRMYRSLEAQCTYRCAAVHECVFMRSRPPASRCTQASFVDGMASSVDVVAARLYDPDPGRILSGEARRGEALTYTGRWMLTVRILWRITGSGRGSCLAIPSPGGKLEDGRSKRLSR